MLSDGTEQHRLTQGSGIRCPIGAGSNRILVVPGPNLTALHRRISSLGERNIAGCMNFRYSYPTRKPMQPSNSLRMDRNKENIVKISHHRHFASLIAVAAFMLAAGCHKKPVPPPPPPPPEATAPAPDRFDHGDPQHHQSGWRRGARLEDHRRDGYLDRWHRHRECLRHAERHADRFDDLPSGRPRPRRLHRCHCAPDGQCGCTAAGRAARP